LAENSETLLTHKVHQPICAVPLTCIGVTATTDENVIPVGGRYDKQHFQSFETGRGLPFLRYLFNLQESYTKPPVGYTCGWKLGAQSTKRCLSPIRKSPEQLTYCEKYKVNFVSLHVQNCNISFALWYKLRQQRRRKNTGYRKRIAGSQGQSILGYVVVSNKNKMPVLRYAIAKMCRQSFS